MGKKERYTILESLPVYGPMYISVTGNDEPFYSEGFVVRFYQSDGMDWVANFKPGWTGLNAVYEFENEVDILVIAGGTCYLINPAEHKAKATFGVGYESVIKTLDGRLILQDLTDLTVFEINGEHWHTERISWDGIKNLKLEGTLVSGLSFDPMNDKEKWVEFIVDLENRNVKGGSYRQYDFKPIEQHVGSVYKRNEEKRPWWKIW
jgi:hypothetical protein